MNTQDRPTHALRIVSVGLYVLAAIVLVLGVYLGLSLASAPAALRSATIAFQTPLVQVLLNGVSSALLFAGVALAVISLAIGLLLVACGLLLRRSAALAVRVGRLEQALAGAQTQAEVDEIQTVPATRAA